MKKEYDFSKGKRGPVIPSPGKTKIIVRIDDDILEWFRVRIEKACRGSYQSAINEALRAYMESREGRAETAVRKVVREKRPGYPVRKKKEK